MPIVVAAIPIAQGIAAGIAAIRLAITANRVRVAVQGARTATAVLQAANQAEKSEDDAVPKTDTTTVVGNKKLDCGEDGSYGDMQKKTGDNKFDRDHVPSKAALQEAAEELIERIRIPLTDAQRAALFGDNGLISKAGQTIIIPKRDHIDHSRTYGGRNTPDKISEDSKDLQEAAEKDTDSIENAEGKEMDADCLEKYKSAAEKIKKKTHAEYLEDFIKLIKEVRKNIK